ncbi:MAG: tetratricopeptide repeat protein [Thermoplasmataceae archaeon]
MERVFNYREASDYFIDLIDKSKISGTSFLLMGKSGWGKTAAMNFIEEFARQKGMNVFRAKSFYSDEALMYQAYNELLNQLLGTFEERDLARIVEIFSHFSGEKARNTIFILDNIESMIQPSRELFVYLSRLSRKNGYIFMASFNEELILDQDVVRKFLNVVTMENNIWVLNFRKPDIEDMNYFLRQRQFKLPISFVQELYRLTNGNIRYADYALKYYQERGIINSNNELEEVTYRFFPIPPSFETRLERVLADMEDPDLSILGLIALTSEELSPGFIARMLELERSEVLHILDKLTEAGFVTHNDVNYSLVNRRINDLVLGALSEKKSLVLSDHFLKQPSFNELPALTKIKIYLLVKDPEAIEREVEGEWTEIRLKLPFINSSPEMFVRILKMVSSDGARAHLSLLAAYAYEIAGQTKEAISLCNSENVIKVEPVFARITLARLYRKAGRYADSVKLCEELLPSLEADSRDYAETLMTMAVDYSYMENRDLTVKYANDARRIAEKKGFEDVAAEALNLLGTMSVRSFQLNNALDLYKKSLVLNQKMRHYEAELLSLNNIAIIYSYQGKLEESAKMLTEIIEKSYISGALMSRAYATYNLCEIYYTTGRFEEFRQNITSAQKLIRIVDDSNLTYPFLRFMATINLNSFNLETAITFINEMNDLAVRNGNSVQETVCRGLKYVVEGFQSFNFNPNLDKVFLTSFPEADDYLPMWYTIGAMKFAIDGKTDEASKAAELAMKQAQGIGDFLGLLVAKIAGAIALASRGKVNDLKKYLDENLPQGSDTYIYGYVVELLRHMASGSLQDIKSDEKPRTLVGLCTEVIAGLHNEEIEKMKTTKGEYIKSVYTQLTGKVSEIYDGFN